MPRRKISNFLRGKVEILSPNCALESLWIIVCVLSTLWALVPSQMPMGHHIVCGPGNLSSTMLTEKPGTLLTIFWTRDPTAMELPEVLSNFSSLYSWRQFCCGNDKLKSPKCTARSLFGVFVDYVSVMFLPLTSTVQLVCKSQALKPRKIYNYWLFACHLISRPHL